MLYPYRKFIFLTLASIVFVLLSFVFRNLLLSGVLPTNLSEAPNPAGSVSIDIVPQDQKHKSAVYGKDFTFEKTKYFEGGVWAVINFTNSAGNNGAIVAKKIDGVYIVVAGPASQFSNSLQSSLPESVNNYLLDEGLING